MTALFGRVYCTGMDTTTVDLHFSSERVKAIRAKLGLTQAQFAKNLNVTPRAVQFWEDGERTPTGHRILSVLLDAAMVTGL